MKILCKVLKSRGKRGAGVKVVERKANWTTRSMIYDFRTVNQCQSFSNGIGQFKICRTNLAFCLSVSSLASICIVVVDCFRSVPGSTVDYL